MLQKPRKIVTQLMQASFIRLSDWFGLILPVFCICFNFIKIKTMEVNWTFLGIVSFCVIIIIVYLIRINLKDKKEVTKFFTEQIKTEKKDESDDDEL